MAGKAPISSSGKASSLPARHTSPARSAAAALLEALYRHPGKDVPLPVLLEEKSARRQLTPRDTALTMELVYGVLRTEKRLWAELTPFLRKPDSLPTPLKVLLLTASYELLFLDHIPSRATLHQTVDMARRRLGPAMGGLVNAVLRGLDSRAAQSKAEDNAFSVPMPESDITAADVARLGSLPDWLADLWINDYGPEQALRFARRSSVKPPPSWRINLARPDSAALLRDLAAAGARPVGQSGLLASLEGLSENHGTATDPPPLGRASQGISAWKPLEDEGRVTRQGMASVLLAEHLAAIIRRDAVLSGAPLWDACCGRGGKTCALLEHGVHVTLSSDPSPRRLDALRASLQRLKLPAPDILPGTVQDMAADYPAHFPLILLDAPCSGTGTLARNAELRLRLTPHRLKEAAALQAELLRHAWTALAPGGLLAYATCALNKAENEDQVRAFLATTPTARLMEQRLFEPDAPGQDTLFLALLCNV